MFFPPEVFYCPSDDRAVGMPQNQPGTDIVTDAEEIEILSQLSVVSLLDLFEKGQIFLEVFLL